MYAACITSSGCIVQPLRQRRTAAKAEQVHSSEETPRAAIPTPIQGQIAAILSQTTPYSLPKEPSSVLRTLVDLATYAKSLEEELAILKGTALPDLPIVDSSTAYTRPPTPTDLSLTATDGCVLTGDFCHYSYIFVTEIYSRAQRAHERINGRLEP
jgi:hypothetical protein